MSALSVGYSRVPASSGLLDTSRHLGTNPPFETRLDDRLPIKVVRHPHFPHRPRDQDASKICSSRYLVRFLFLASHS